MVLLQVQENLGTESTEALKHRVVDSFPCRRGCHWLWDGWLCELDVGGMVFVWSEVTPTLSATVSPVCPSMLVAQTHNYDWKEASTCT
jgi:hypothetical protein